MGVPSYSTTAGSNTTIAGINIAEGWAPSSVNNAFRAALADTRKMYDDGAAKIVAGGSANAITLTTSSTWAALADGIKVAFRAANSNSNSTVTLALDGLTAKNVYRQDGTALQVGDIVSGGIYQVAYSSLANASAGGWLLLNPTLGSINIDGATALTAPDIADEAIVYDASATANRKIVLSDLLKVVNGLTADASPDTANDYLLSYDASATAAKKVLMSTLLGSTSGAVKTVKIQVFTASGTYTPNTGMLYALLVCLGAGAGGGGNTGTGSSAGGGGAGSESWKLASAADIGASKTVTIGGGGNGAASGNNAGSAGGDTSIGSLCIGKGGTGGAGASSAASQGGLGGVAGTGDIAGTGMPGDPGTAGSGSGSSGSGGSSRFGGGGRGRAATGTGSAATGYGSGGGGGQGSTSSGGGAGTDGLAFVIEFCSQ